MNKIGLELHFQINTKTKLFSASPNSFAKEPNTSTTSYDWGYPGTLPQLNEKVVKSALQASYLLNCQIADVLLFDRKNYHYFDLPKGYQITQFRKPIGEKGNMRIFLPNQKWKKISILQICIEEDTAKTHYENNNIFVDYNRSGAPLMEVVTAPDFNNFQEVEVFLKKIIRLFNNHSLSSGDLSKGSLRIDLNISSSIDGKYFCPRTEIKNLNSFQNIKKSIEQESFLQKQNINKIEKACTKNYDEKTKKLVFLRNKFEKSDYFFIPENNLAPIYISKKFVNDSVFDVKGFLHYESKIIQDHQLLFSHTEFLFDKQFLIPYFLKLNTIPKSKLDNVFLFLKQVVIAYFNSKLPFSKFNFSLAKQLLFLFDQKKINFKSLEKIFLKYYLDNKFNLNEFLLKKESKVLSKDELKELYVFLDQFCHKNPNFKQQHREKNNKSFNYLMGQIPTKFRTLTSPKLLIEIIKNYFN